LLSQDLVVVGLVEVAFFLERAVLLGGRNVLGCQPVDPTVKKHLGFVLQAFVRLPTNDKLPALNTRRWGGQPCTAVRGLRGVTRGLLLLRRWRYSRALLMRLLCRGRWHCRALLLRLLCRGRWHCRALLYRFFCRRWRYSRALLYRFFYRRRWHCRALLLRLLGLPLSSQLLMLQRRVDPGLGLLRLRRQSDRLYTHHAVCDEGLV
jgi:hypothetical protein